MTLSANLTIICVWTFKIDVITKKLIPEINLQLKYYKDWIKQGNHGRNTFFFRIKLIILMGLWVIVVSSKLFDMVIL